MHVQYSMLICWTLSFMDCRSQSKAEEAMTKIRKTYPQAKLEYLANNTSSLRPVRSTAINFLNRSDQLDILLLNAGGIVDKPQASKDELEWIFAINHLAHFLLSMTLLPALEKAASRPDGDVTVACTTFAGFGLHPDRESLHITDAELKVESPES